MAGWCDEVVYAAMCQTAKHRHRETGLNETALLSS